jgi:hypothetical protein
MASLRLEIAPDIHVSTFLPGVVATELGNDAKHGGADSRGFPNAQSAAEVGQIIADLARRALLAPRARAAGRPHYTADDVATVEAGRHAT